MSEKIDRLRSVIMIKVQAMNLLANAVAFRRLLEGDAGPSGLGENVQKVLLGVRILVESTVEGCDDHFRKLFATLSREEMLEVLLGVAEKKDPSTN